MKKVVNKSVKRSLSKSKKVEEKIKEKEVDDSENAETLDKGVEHQEENVEEEVQKPFKRKRAAVKQYLVSGLKNDGSGERVAAFFLACSQMQVREFFMKKFPDFQVVGVMETAESDKPKEWVLENDPFQWIMK